MNIKADMNRLLGVCNNTVVSQSIRRLQEDILIASQSNYHSYKSDNIHKLFPIYLNDDDCAIFSSIQLYAKFVYT